MFLYHKQAWVWPFLCKPVLLHPLGLKLHNLNLCSPELCFQKRNNYSDITILTLRVLACLIPQAWGLNIYPTPCYGGEWLLCRWGAKRFHIFPSFKRVQSQHSSLCWEDSKCQLYTFIYALVNEAVGRENLDTQRGKEHKPDGNDDVIPICSTDCRHIPAGLYQSKGGSTPPPNLELCCRMAMVGAHKELRWRSSPQMSYACVLPFIPNRRPERPLLFCHLLHSEWNA